VGDFDFTNIQNLQHTSWHCDNSLILAIVATQRIWQTVAQSPEVSWLWQLVNINQHQSLTQSNSSIILKLMFIWIEKEVIFSRHHNNAVSYIHTITLLHVLVH
jgi:hypothetical protein